MQVPLRIFGVGFFLLCICVEIFLRFLRIVKFVVWLEITLKHYCYTIALNFIEKMNRIYRILTVAAVFVFAACNHDQGNVRESGTTFAQEALQPFVDSGQLPGAISVLYNNGVQETCCIGYADPRTKRPITMDDVFMQCSQTKGFCGVTIAKLVEEGKISLDDPVSKYLPEFSTLWVLDEKTDSTMTLHKAKNVLTVRMCLNHTGGFPFECSAKRKDVRGGGWSGGAPIRQVASIAAESPIMFEPGTRELYSNTGIDIGAAVVETVTGMKWENYLKETVLDPLGMKDTWFWPTDKQLDSKIELFTGNRPSGLRRIRGSSVRTMTRMFSRLPVLACGLLPMTSSSSIRCS